MMTLLGSASITLDAESLSSTSLRYGSSRLEDAGFD